MCCDSTRQPGVGGGSARMCRAARSPSSVNVGGIRMSTTATSGRAASTSASRPSSSPAEPDDLEPAVRQQALQARPEEDRVLADHDAHGIVDLDPRCHRRPAR